MIEVERLSKHYGAKKAVDDISFTANEGEILGFLGHNGAGKSTTMNMLTGYISCTSGRARINGIDVLEDPIKAKKNIGYLPEQPPLYLEMTVNEYLKFIHGLKHSKLKRDKHIGEICDLVKITRVRDRVIRNMSKGFRQRVGLAGALIGNPKTMILDEPTVGLDPQQIIEIRSLIKRLGNYHSVIFSSHILSEVQATCDRVIIINNGRIIADAKTNELAGKFADLSKTHLLIDPSGKKNYEIKKILSKLPNVINVASPDKAYAQNETEFDIKSADGTDNRRAIFGALSAHNIPILQMRAEEPTLEEIFIKITAEADHHGADANNEDDEDDDTDNVPTVDIDPDEITDDELTGDDILNNKFSGFTVKKNDGEYEDNTDNNNNNNNKEDDE
ncbi:MAG: ABC transporter ATP-binding protein [Oscillospiraceae bacterium]|jgi:ABC-2 type transport system ATP-binding protein|nr:ABC transporter ATP-binding protein [Oscillospiraceae bacterium]